MKQRSHQKAGTLYKQFEEERAVVGAPAFPSASGPVPRVAPGFSSCGVHREQCSLRISPLARFDREPLLAGAILLRRHLFRAPLEVQHAERLEVGGLLTDRIEQGQPHHRERA